MLVGLNPVGLKLSNRKRPSLFLVYFSIFIADDRWGIKLSCGFTSQKLKYFPISHLAPFGSTRCWWLSTHYVVKVLGKRSWCIVKPGSSLRFVCYDYEETKRQWTSRSQTSAINKKVCWLFFLFNAQHATSSLGRLLLQMWEGFGEEHREWS